jgi:hypothetical protein
MEKEKLKQENHRHVSATQGDHRTTALTLTGSHAAFIYRTAK